MEEEIRRSTRRVDGRTAAQAQQQALTGEYGTIVGANVPRDYAISRADTAHAMLAVLNDPATIRQAFGVAY
jgi:putative NADH-flavin reductase